MRKQLIVTALSKVSLNRRAGAVAAISILILSAFSVSIFTSRAQAAGLNGVGIKLQSSSNYLAFDARNKAIQSSKFTPYDITGVDSGYALLKHLGSGKCVNVTSGNDFTRPTLTTCSATDKNQHWKISSQITARNSGKVLEAYYNWMRSGDPVDIYSNHQGANQTWSLRTSSGTVVTWPESDSTVNNMPTTAKIGFRYAGGEDFLSDAAAGNVAAPLGDNSARPYNDKLVPYGDWAGNNGGTYKFQQNVSVHDGYLDAQVRTLNGEPTGSAWVFRTPDTNSDEFIYGAVEQRVRFVGNAPHYGSASILWPSSEVWGEGEIDFPEGSFGFEPNAFHHCLGTNQDAARNCDVFATGLANWSGWHIYRIEWTPSGTSYFVDGRRIGTNTNATPTTRHHWVTQMAVAGLSAEEESQIPTRISEESGNYQVDWARFESYVGQ